MGSLSFLIVNYASLFSNRVAILFYMFLKSRTFRIYFQVIKLFNLILWETTINNPTVLLHFQIEFVFKAYFTVYLGFMITDSANLAAKSHLSIFIC